MNTGAYPHFPVGSDKKPLGPWKGPANWSPDPPVPGQWHGVPCGAASGLLVIDLDVRPTKDGRASLAAYEAAGGHHLPNTRTVATPSGGLHLYFRYPEAATIRNRTGVLLGVDVRGEGGYVVGAGSPNYTVVHDAEVADPPEWLLELVRPKVTASAAAATDLRVASPDDPYWSTLVREAEHYAATESPAIQGEKGSDRLLNFTRNVRQFFGLPRDEARRILGIYSARCVPPWSDKEIEHKLDDTDKLRLPDGIATGWQVPDAAPGESFFWPLAAPPVLPKVAPDAAPGSWRRQRDSGHRYTFDSGLEVHGGSQEKTAAISDKALASLFIGASANKDWCGVWQWDDFNERLVAVNPPMKLDAETTGLTSRDLVEIKLYVACNLSKSVSVDRVRETIEAAGNKCRFNPIRDYLDSLPKVSGEDASAYFRGIAGRLWGASADRGDLEIESDILMRQAVAAVRRVRHPGTKVDEMLIFHGSQGYNKSRFLALLFGGFFSDQLPGDLAGRDASHALRGKWGVEIAELRWGRSEENVKKGFFSRQEDIYRDYGTGLEIRRLRQCVFFGTTNDDAFLRDPTGARRFNVVHVLQPIDVDGFDRDMFWAAANALEASGERHYFTTAESESMHDSKAQHFDGDPWTDVVLAYARRQIDRVTAAQCLTEAIPVPLDRQSAADLARVQKILRLHLGPAVPRRVDGRQQRVYLIT